ncbi:putative polysaccharide biosynthesis protein [Enterococcus florum]|nr:polysaccharide biosynthesis protein [Enterococcus florum]
MQGAFVLTAASFIAKLLSAVYRVPYQNLAGDEGFYVYQQIYPIYGLAMTLALSGLPQFISKYVAEKSGPKKQQQALQALFPLVTGLGIVLSLFLFSTSNQLAFLMGDQQLAPLIRVVSFAFLIMPFLSLIRGEFQGRLLMMPTAVSQVVEQLIRVTVILLAAGAFQQFGWSVYQTGTAAMAGALFGGAAALLVLLYYQRKILGSKTPWLGEKMRPERQLIRRLLLEGGLMTVYSGYLILFQLIDSFTIKKALVDFGLSEHGARLAKGVYDRGQPLVQLGLVVALALSSSFLPMLTRYLSKQEMLRFQQACRVFLRLTCGIAAAASVGLAWLLPYVNYALFTDADGNFTLILFVFAIFLMAMIQTYQSIAQSQNRFRGSLRAAGWGFLVKALTTGLLTHFFGTAGASAATLLGLTVALLVLHRQSVGLTGYLQQRSFGYKLLGCLLGMSAVLLLYHCCMYLFFGTIAHRGQALILAVIGVGIGGGTFLFLAVRLKLLTVREWLMLPLGNKLLRLKWKR